jgi:hypothetical protein
MAAESDAATDRVTCGSAPSMAAISFCCWVKIVTASAGSFNPITRFYTNSGDASSWIIGFKGTNGRTPAVYSPGNTTGISGAEQTLNTWVFIGATLSGTAAQLFYGNTPGTLTKVTGTVAASGTPDRLTLFGRSAADGSEWLRGIQAYDRLWTALISDAEMAAESLATAPARTSGLWASWPFAAAALTDASGNGRNLTAGSTALSSATDPTLGSPTEAGTATLTLGASGTQSRVATDAGAAATALDASGTPQHVAAAAGTSTVTLGATGTGQHAAATAGTASMTLDATGTAATLRAAAGTAALALAAAGSSTHVATDAGTAAVTLDASGTHTHVVTLAGLAALTLGSDGTAVHVAVDAGSAAIALAGSGTQLRTTTAAGSAALTLQATGTVDSGGGEDAGNAALTLGADGPHTAVRAAAGSASLTLEAAGVDQASTVVGSGAAVLVLDITGTFLTIRSSAGQAALQLVATGVVSGEQRDITVTAVLLPGRFTTRLLPSRYTARLLPPRFHAKEAG